MEFLTTSPRSIMSLQQRASDILEACPKRPLIALDLDYTMWQTNCYEHTAPPYKRTSENQKTTTPKSSSNSNNNALVDDGSVMKEKIFCIDRRTNRERSIVLYPQIKSILEWCADNRVTLTLCSKSPDLSLVKQILQTFGIWDWFLFPQIFNSRKTYHFRNLTEATGLKMNDFLFFDDDITNINLCTKIGVSSCLVDKSQGLTWQTFVDGLTLYYNTQKSVMNLSAWLSPSNEAKSTSNHGSNAVSAASLSNNNNGSTYSHPLDTTAAGSSLESNSGNITLIPEIKLKNSMKE